MQLTCPHVSHCRDSQMLVCTANDLAPSYPRTFASLRLLCHDLQMSLLNRYPSLDPEIAAILEALPAISPTSTIEGDRQAFQAFTARVQEGIQGRLPSGMESRGLLSPSRCSSISLHSSVGIQDRRPYYPRG